MRKLFIVIIFFMIPSIARLQVNNETLKSKIAQTIILYNKDAMYQQLDSLNKLQGLSPENSACIKFHLAKEELRLKKYSNCLTTCYAGISVSKKNGLDSFHIAFYRLLGNESYYTRKLPQAITLFKKGLAMAEAKNIIELQASICQSIGGVSLDIFLIDSTQKQQLDTSSKYLNLAVQKSSACDENCKFTRLMSLRLLASFYDTKKDYPKAKKIFDTVELEASVFKDTMLLATAFVAYANMLFKIGDIKNGTQKTETALELMRKFKNRSDATYVLILGYLAKRREDAGKHKEASALKSEIIGLQENMYKSENQMQINELETQFKVKEIEQEKNIATANALAEVQKKKALLFILLAVSLLAVLIITLVYFFNKKKQADAKIESQKLIVSSILETEEKERSRIAKDLHDGIVQDLTAIKLDIKSMVQQAPENIQTQLNRVLDNVDVTSKEVREISYQMMPVTLRELGLLKAIQELLNRSLNKNNIQFELNTFGIEQRLSEKIETTVYRICQELINNTIKHSQANSVSLLLQLKNNILQLTYEDDGVGFNSTTVKKGIGLSSLNSRIEMVKGSLEFDATATTGTTAYIRIPL